MFDFFFPDEAKGELASIAMEEVDTSQPNFVYQAWGVFRAYLSDIELLDSMLRNRLVEWVQENSGSSTDVQAILDLWAMERKIRGAV